MPEYKTPGVYIEEIPKLPPSIASVETAIPAFIGYTEQAQKMQAGDLLLMPTRISSIIEYELYFGGAANESSIEVLIDATQAGNTIINASVSNPSPYLLYYSLQLFFANGGGPCWIVAVGGYNDERLIDKPALSAGLNAIKKINEITLVVFPDSIHLSSTDLYYSLYKEAMQQCAEPGDRFTIMDVWIDKDVTVDNVQTLRDSDLGTSNELKYGAAYYPLLNAIIGYRYEENSVMVKAIGDSSLPATLDDLKEKNNSLYMLAVNSIKNMPMVLPVAPAAAGIYAQTDNTRGVWKAPANVSVNAVIGPVIAINQQQQEPLNVDPIAGKSINVVRHFAGRGNAIIWGARTLAGNDNEWRYISVRRFVNMVEESVRNATRQFVFEPNDANTWVRIKSMIQDYLTQLWKAGALMGTTTKEAFFVHVGLGETMTAQDILEGRLIVEIGMAVVRPAEFIILRVQHTMIEA